MPRALLPWGLASARPSQFARLRASYSCAFRNLDTCCRRDPHAEPSPSSTNATSDSNPRCCHSGRSRIRRSDNYFGAVGDSRNRAQIGFFGWQPDYPTPSAFFRSLFTCKSFLPDNPNNLNGAELCDPRIDRQIERALREQTTNPSAARERWQRIDREITDQAPWIPLFTPKSVDVLSKRVGNYQYSPSGFGMLIDQLWVH